MINNFLSCLYNMNNLSCTMIFWLIIAVLCSALPLPLIKDYAIENNKWSLVLGLFFHISLFVAYIYIFMAGYKVNIIYPIIKIVSIILVIVATTIFFKESLNKEKIIGLILGLVSIYLLSCH